jgi:hypothetical protein
MVQKFVEYQASDKCMDDVNAWFKLSQVSNTPYITVEKKKKYADVQWDYISFTPEVDDLIDLTGDAFVEGLLSVFNKYINQKSAYTLNNRVAEFKNIEIESARHMASEMYDYINAMLLHARSKARQPRKEK